ncbi:MAG: hypothetical protein LUG93_04985 [Lachnospiraceae bacterium]|nr:hypothetical protein [Lachnospiraceae bacterium]
MIKLAVLVFFFLQVYVIYNYYFYTGWDVGNILIPAVQQAAQGGDMSSFSTYFSHNPNNLFLVFLFSVIRKIDLKIGILDVETGLMGLIIFQCLLCSIASYLTYRCAEILTHSRTISMGVWVLFIGLVGVSPWISIPYSDGTGLVFPVTILYLYLQIKKNGKRFLWFFVGALTIIGYRIKPQILIIVLAIIIYEIIQLLSGYKAFSKQIFKGILKSICCFTAAAVLTYVLSGMAVRSLGIETDDEQAMGMAHYLMMGLNEKSNGIWNEEDVLYSQSYETVSERTQADLELAAERVESMGISGMLLHLAKKSLTNFADGTFAWTNEGAFFTAVYADKNTWISPHLKACYYPEGIYYSLWQGFAQTVWMFVLFGLLGLILMRIRRKETGALTVPVLAVLGLILFELLFEARARYLFTYVPVFVLLSAIGWREIFAVLSRGFSNIKFPLDR